MGTIGTSIVDMDVNELIEMLNKAFADEWLAYYQYWIGAKIVRGKMSESVIAELEQHATDELRHAGMLVQRIVQLGGTPILNPDQWKEMSHCGFDEPINPDVLAILKQNIKGEQCAISVYNDIVKKTRDADPITHQIVLEILKDEVEHEDDLQALEEDIQKT